MGVISGVVASVMAVLGSSWYSLVTHEWSHYVAGRLAGVPSQCIRVRMRPHPPHVALHDGQEWLSPDHRRYVDTFCGYQPRVGWAWAYVAAGTVGGLLLVVVAAAVLVAFGLVIMALILVGTSAAITLVYVLGDVFLTRRRGAPAGDFSAMWQISKAGTAIMLIAVFSSYTLAIVIIGRF